MQLVSSHASPYGHPTVLKRLVVENTILDNVPPGPRWYYEYIFVSLRGIAERRVVCRNFAMDMSVEQSLNSLLPEGPRVQGDVCWEVKSK
jgi:hypothetical protein